MLLGFQMAQINFKDRLMQFGSGGKIIHCQFVFEQYGKVCASAWDLYGIGFRPYEDTVKAPETLWEWLDFGPEKDQELYDWFRHRLGIQYDLTGLLTSFIVPRQKLQTPKTFCSEVCYGACQEVLGLNLPAVNPNYLSPQGLYNLIKTGKL
jgi:hypothetical protein